MISKREANEMAEQFLKEQTMSRMQTFTGVLFDPISPEGHRPVDIADVAHALAMKCRFGGHCNSFYSVAEHSVRVSRRAEELAKEPAAIAGERPSNQRFVDECAMLGLLHDAAEAYLPDVIRPIKGQILVDVPSLKKVDRFVVVEDRLLDAILVGLGLDQLTRLRGFVGRGIVKQADLELLATERRDLMEPGNDEEWAGLPDPLERKILPLDHVASYYRCLNVTRFFHRIEEQFLERFAELRTRLANQPTVGPAEAWACDMISSANLAADQDYDLKEIAQDVMAMVEERRGRSRIIPVDDLRRGDGDGSWKS